MEVSQYTVIVERPTNLRTVVDKEDPFFFKNFSRKSDVIASVSALSEPLKVKSIYEFYSNGKVDELTIGFNNGRLDLIKVPETRVIGQFDQ